tara:strand:+ start:6437 stop:10525 length:4089 start_codon:yes stop_codon:yes gene_type:complete
MSIFEKNDGMSVSTDANGMVTTARQVPAVEPVVEAPSVASNELAAAGFQPEQHGAFVPAQSGGVQGDFGDAFSMGYKDTILGALGDEDSSVARNDRATAEASAYARDHGVLNFVGNMAGGIVGDAPIELGLIFVAPLALSSMARGLATHAPLAASRLRRASETLNVLQKSEATGKNMTRVARVTERMRYEAAVGALSGAISQELQEEIKNTEGRSGATLDRMIQDSVGGALFSEALRAGGKLFTRAKVKEDILETFKEDAAVKASTPEETGLAVQTSKEGVVDNPPEAELPPGPEQAQPASGVNMEFNADPALEQGQVPALDRGDALVDLEPAERPKAERGQEEILDAESPTPAELRKKLQEPETKSAVDTYNSEPTKENFSNAVNSMMDDGNRNADMGGKVADIVEARAKAAGMTFEEYVKVKGLNLRNAAQASVIFEEGRIILNAPHNATSAGDFIHELGHIFRSDLDAKANATLEKAFGVKNGNWTRTDEESLADAFVDYVATGELPAGASSRLKKAFNAVSTWLRDVYASITGNEVEQLSPEMQDVFKTLFDTENGPSAVPSAKGEFDAFKQREAMGTTQLFADGGPQGAPKPTGTTSRREQKRKERKAKTVKDKTSKVAQDKKADADRTAKQETVANAASEQDNAQQEIRNAVLNSNDGLANSTGAAVTPSGKVLNRIVDAAPQSLTTDNRSVQGMLSMMGGAGKLVKKAMTDSIQRVAALKNGMRKDLTIARKGLSKAEKTSMKAKTAVSFETMVDGRATTVQVGMSRQERIELYMASMDGFTKDKSSVSKNASQHDLVHASRGFVTEDSDIPLVLTKRQLESIQEGDFLSVREKEIAESIWSMYRNAVDPLNKETLRIAGDKVADANHWYYTPKRIVGDPDEGNFMDALSTAVKRGENSGVAGSVNLRSAGGIHQFDDPFKKAQSYLNSMSETVGGGEFTSRYQVLVNENKHMIEKYYGKNWYGTMKDFERVMTGNAQGLLGKSHKVTSALLSFRSMAYLGINPSVMLKQVGSAWSAAATGKLNANGHTLAVHAAKLSLKGSKELATLQAEMKAKSAFWVNRQESGGMSLEMQDFLFENNIDIMDIDEANLTELFGKLAKKGEFGSGYTGLVIKGMQGIRHMDEATMSAIWKATKDTVQSAGQHKEGTPDYWKAVNELFTDIAAESQPTSEVATKSINQMKKGVVAKAFSQFSSQTRKNAEISANLVTAYVNKKNKTPADAYKLAEGMFPLAVQTAYITAVGATVKEATTYTTEALGANPNKRSRDQKKFDSLVAKSLIAYMRNTLGQIPMTGKMAESLIAAGLGAPVYNQMSVPIVDEMGKIIEGLKDRDVAKMIRPASAMMGAPQTLVRPATN